MAKFILGILTFFAFTQVANANSTSCYEFKIENSAEMTPRPVVATQKWCYRQLSSPAGAIYIFDSENIRPELSAVMQADGIVIHGSMIKGKVTTHQVNASDLNPLPVPLKEPSVDSPRIDTEIDEAKLSESLDFLLTSRIQTHQINIEEGTFTAAVPAANYPWRGYWWPFRRNEMGGGINSPMAKYDRYVRSRTGVSPGAQAWELSNHEYTGASWGGHCNGWAASAVSRAEPNRNRTHAASGVTFSVGDQKGILAEEDYCARIAFYGRRNYGRPGNDPKDIYPAEFHKVITYYVGQLGKVVAVDYMSSPVVDTHLIGGYTLRIRKESASSFLVTANLRVHRYDRSPNLPPGTAPTYTRTYKYRLRTNAAGTPVSGTWLSANPDFLWVPLSPVNCPSSNPRLSAQFVREILNLPPRAEEP